MSQKNMSQKIPYYYALPAIILGTLLAVAIIFAWTEPTQAPPGGNVPSPVNVGSVSQYKSGALGIGGLLRGYSTVIFDGSVGIGTAGPNYKLDVTGDIHATGWLRTDGAAGWYSQSYGGGWYMSDASWLRTYGSKSIWTDTGLLASNGGLTVGYSASTPPSGGAVIAGNVGIGTTAPGTKLDVAGGSIRTANQLISTLAAGTAPLVVNSNTVVANLNADMLDGYHASAFGDATLANQTTILNRIGIASDAASMDTTLFAGQQAIYDKISTGSGGTAFRLAPYNIYNGISGPCPVVPGITCRAQCGWFANVGNLDQSSFSCVGCDGTLNSSICFYSSL